MRLSTLAILIALAAIASCGGESTLTTEGYLREFGLAQDEVNERTAPSNLRITQELLSERQDALIEFRDWLATLSPPAELDTSHSKTIQGLDGFIEMTRQVQMLLESDKRGSELSDAITAVVEADDAQDSLDQYQGACETMQGMAQMEHIDTLLTCLEDGHDPHVTTCIELENSACDDIEEPCSGDDVPFDTDSPPPTTPQGLVAASDLFRAEQLSGEPVTLCVSLYGDYEIEDGLTLYEYTPDRELLKIDTIVLRAGGNAAEVSIQSLPSEFVILKQKWDWASN